MESPCHGWKTNICMKDFVHMHILSFVSVLKRKLKLNKVYLIKLIKPSREKEQKTKRGAIPNLTGHPTVITVYVWSVVQS